MVKPTMIKMYPETRDKLKKLKITRRESYDEIVNRLMKFYKKNKREI